LFNEQLWEQTRPKTAKGSGVGKALRLWAASCTSEPATFATHQDFDKAIAACNALKTAFAAAVKKMASDKSQQATNTNKLIKDNEPKIKIFLEKCQKVLVQNTAAADAIVANAEREAKKAAAEISKFHQMAGSQVARILEMQTKLGITPKATLTPKVMQEARVELNRWHGSLVNLAAMAEAANKKMLAENAVAEWRRLGALKLVNDHKMSPTKVNHYIGEFQGFTRELSQIEAMAKDIALKRDEYGLVITKLTASTNQFLNDLGAKVAVLQQLAKTTIDARYASIKDPLSKAPSIGSYQGDVKSVEKIYKEHGREGVGKQRHGAQSQIDQIKAKTVRFNQFVADLGRITQGALDGLGPLMQNPNIKPLVDGILERTHQITQDIREWQKQGERVIAQIVAYQKILDLPKFN
jgi:hypothetical protein